MGTRYNVKVGEKLILKRVLKAVGGLEQQRYRRVRCMKSVQQTSGRYNISPDDGRGVALDQHPANAPTYKLGLDIIYIQAKRWDNTVGRPEIQKFAGALQGQRARKGIFITTSEFSREARDYASRIDSKIVLIDGEQLAQMLIDHNIGVAPVVSYEIKRVDSDYFTEQ
jgi:hypothetical protein